MSPTQRSLDKLRKEGFVVANVEKWIPYKNIRQDLFGMFDLLAIRGDLVIGVQTTSASNIRAREKKMRSNPLLTSWLASRYRLAIVHGWGKKKVEGKKIIKKWVCSEISLTLGQAETPHHD